MENQISFKPANPQPPVKTASSDSLFLTPSTHVPGTFPMSIRSNDSSPGSSSRHESTSSSSSASDAAATAAHDRKKQLTRPVSVYDNLLTDHHGDLLKLLRAQDDFHKRGKSRGDSDSSSDVLWDYDQIVDVSNSLQSMIESWEVDLGVGEEGSAAKKCPKKAFKTRQLPSYRKISEVSG